MKSQSAARGVSHSGRIFLLVLFSLSLSLSLLLSSFNTIDCDNLQAMAQQQVVTQVQDLVGDGTWVIPNWLTPGVYVLHAVVLAFDLSLLTWLVTFLDGYLIFQIAHQQPSGLSVDAWVQVMTLFCAILQCFNRIVLLDKRDSFVKISTYQPGQTKDDLKVKKNDYVFDRQTNPLWRRIVAGLEAVVSSRGVGWYA